VAGSASAQSALLEEAEAHAQAGRIDAMRRTYEILLSMAPQNVPALNGRATALAWQGNYAEAEQVYGEALALEPGNIDTLTGLGYARAWNGDYPAALSAFEAATAIAPGHLSARKGEAFVYLWSGNNARAESAFAVLASEYPLDAEILIALGQARLQQGFSRSAVDTFDRAMAVDPAREAARMGRVAAFNAPPSFEFGAWYGSTSNAGAGLRQLDFAYWLNGDTRFAARYDDSLSLDNPALERRGEKAETLLVGATHRLNDTWVIGGEVGVRQLPDGDQDLYRGEVVWAHPRARVTLGMQIGAHDLGYDDTLTYLGFALPLGPHWAVELNN
jgi:tetratricopeptide (TPR) repeat protein